MKKLFSVLAVLFVMTSSMAFAMTPDYGYEQNRMKMTNDGILVVSAFEDQDRLTCYSYSGTRHWETKFGAKIMSYEVVGDYIYAFSKARTGTKTYLTCLDKYTGNMVWERP